MPNFVNISSLNSISPNGFNRSPIKSIHLLNQALFFVQHILEFYHVGIAHDFVKLKGCPFTIKLAMAGMLSRQITFSLFEFLSLFRYISNYENFIKAVETNEVDVDMWLGVSPISEAPRALCNADSVSTFMYKCSCRCCHLDHRFS